MADSLRSPNKDDDDDVTLNVQAYHKFLAEKALTKHHGNRTHAAHDLGISIRTLRNWIAKFHLAKRYPSAT